ncbi:MAG: hypothetical protein OEW05_01855 [Candidatus Aminicenantes bacterium]|nr:hypothetical protein [Candidatus Aminicenantes bacterium]
MSEDSLYRNIVSLGLGIEACLEKKLNISTLILIYSAIDTVGWLNSKGEEAPRESFINWVRDYLLTAKHLECTPLELYAARCGFVHTATSESHLCSGGGVRRISYAIGDAGAQPLLRAFEKLGKSDEVTVAHARDLYEAWKLGVLYFVEEIDKDPIRKKLVYEKANNFYSNLTKSDVSSFLGVAQKD